MPETRLGPYEVLQPIGAGGMGEVYKARDPRLDRLVAIKVLPLRLAHDPQFRNRFDREAKLIAALNHPHICSVYDVGEWEGTTYLVMEYLQGESLHDRLTRGALKVDQALETAGQIASALSAAHRAGIVHRDLKPGNIMLTAMGAKLLDFGLAKTNPIGNDALTQAPTVAPLTMQGSIVGTLQYMAPEQLEGRACDARTDIFAFGAVLYEMLTGERAFAASSEARVIAAILHGELPVGLKGVPPTVGPLIGLCLKVNPDERWRDGVELQTALSNVVNRSTTAHGERKDMAARRWWLPAVTASILIASVLGWYWYYVRTPVVSSGATTIRSIAVLPFQNLSGDAKQEFFSDGATEELISTLSQLRAFDKVISRTSVMHYKGTAITIPEVGRELGVDAVVEGSVERTGGQVRVRAQLVRAATDTTIWAQEYTRVEGDLLSLEAEVARAIAGEIRLEVTPQERAQLNNAHPLSPEAQEAYLLGRYHAAKFNTTDLREAITQYERTAALEPTFAAAYVGLAGSWGQLMNLGGALPAEALGHEQMAAQRAMQLAPDTAMAHQALGAALGDAGRPVAEWEREFEQAATLEPNRGSAQMAYALGLYRLRRFPEARVAATRAAALDPLSSSVQLQSAGVLFATRNYEQAVVLYRRAIELDSTGTTAYGALARAYLQTNRATQAIDLITHMPRQPGDEGLYDAMLGSVYAIAGHRDQALALLKSSGNFPLVGAEETYLAFLCFALGEKDRGFTWLEKALEKHEGSAYFNHEFAPEFDSVRADPRFRALVTRLGAPD